MNRAMDTVASLNAQSYQELYLDSFFCRFDFLLALLASVRLCSGQLSKFLLDLPCFCMKSREDLVYRCQGMFCRIGKAMLIPATECSHCFAAVPETSLVEHIFTIGEYFVDVLDRAKLLSIQRVFRTQDVGDGRVEFRCQLNCLCGRHIGGLLQDVGGTTDGHWTRGLKGGACRRVLHGCDGV